jgi:hypothetical protein
LSRVPAATDAWVLRLQRGGGRVRSPRSSADAIHAATDRKSGKAAGIKPQILAIHQIRSMAWRRGSHLSRRRPFRIGNAMTLTAHWTRGSGQGASQARRSNREPLRSLQTPVIRAARRCNLTARFWCWDILDAACSPDSIPTERWMAILVPQVGSTRTIFLAPAWRYSRTAGLSWSNRGFVPSDSMRMVAPIPHLASGVWRALRAYRVVAASNQ